MSQINGIARMLVNLPIVLAPSVNQTLPSGPALTPVGPVSELEAGLWYVDLTRARMPEIAPRLEALAAARGVVFDLRGYPSDAGFGILPHLLAAPRADFDAALFFPEGAQYFPFSSFPEAAP